jgi:hypothetical protein
MGTYLDLYFVGKGMYSFPKRVLPDIFSINIIFTIGILPVFTVAFLSAIKNITFFKRWSLVLMISLMIACIERVSENYGFFVHTEQWKHTYSFIGYFAYMIVMWRFYQEFLEEC